MGLYLYIKFPKSTPGDGITGAVFLLFPLERSYSYAKSSKAGGPVFIP